ncbi:energy transducer TonB [Paludibacterium purpuratum]|uniref:Outer membrane transport energization protein TonB n=1 Tax=Paludibacterium purpuratum TaxID=1144873 RepID=A0A4R7BGF5_9NEIS|nr:energy transducer TonB [Paludibacterium purpuratum]TDR82847.1 outer membrane transport energization protein TonB [Paludibacterium purpuratum]
MATKRIPVSTARERHGRIAILLAVGTAHVAGLAWLGAGRAPPPRPEAVTPPIVTGRLIPSSPAERPKSVAQMPAPLPNRHPAMTPPHPSPSPVSRHPASPALESTSATPSSTQATQRTPSPAAGESAPVVPPLANASGLDNPLPDYPALSRRLGEEGTVLLSVLILADGRVAEVALARSSGYPRLDAAALAAVRRWHYRPARRGAEPIDYRYTQPVAFSLND